MMNSKPGAPCLARNISCGCGPRVCVETAAGRRGSKGVSIVLCVVELSCKKNGGLPHEKQPAPQQGGCTFTPRVREPVSEVNAGFLRCLLCPAVGLMGNGLNVRYKIPAHLLGLL